MYNVVGDWGVPFAIIVAVTVNDVLGIGFPLESRTVIVNSTVSPTRYVVFVELMSMLAGQTTAGALRHAPLLQPLGQLMLVDDAEPAGLSVQKYSVSR